MSYSNKIFNVNGIGKDDLYNCLKLALLDSNIYGYRVDDNYGLEIFLSKTLLPIDDAVIVNDMPSPLEAEMSIILGYLDKMKDSVMHDEEDAIIEEMALSGLLSYRLGWRVYTKLDERNDRKWWNHSVWVRPSYITINEN